MPKHTKGSFKMKEFIKTKNDFSYRSVDSFKMKKFKEVGFKVDSRRDKPFLKRETNQKIPLGDQEKPISIEVKKEKEPEITQKEGEKI